MALRPGLYAAVASSAAVLCGCYCIYYRRRRSPAEVSLNPKSSSSPYPKRPALRWGLEGNEAMYKEQLRLPPGCSERAGAMKQRCTYASGDK
jgi:hypothetical protein